MAACENAKAIEELEITQGTILEQQVLESDTPWVIRGYLQDWPVVKAGKESVAGALSYLTSFYSGRPINAFLAEPDNRGRFF